MNDILQNQIVPLLPQNSYLVADNASIHNEIQIARILSTKNITLVKLPAYSYDLNPIEMVFCHAKAIARYNPGYIRENPLLAIVSAFQKIDPVCVRNFYRRSWNIFV